ncbi:BCCT family transporter [Plesiomonas shigelloides subsp. oncorhynchi]|nr:BCCT family transporter [Plesiomonas shigelloides]
MFCRYGDLRLGDDDQKPEFSYMAWFAMLFSAGMGIGLIFWSIAEPVFHLQGNPFITEGGTPEAAKVAMRITWFHWGLHPWAIYSIVGLSLSFFCYRKNCRWPFAQYCIRCWATKFMASGDIWLMCWLYLAPYLASPRRWGWA